MNYFVTLLLQSIRTKSETFLKQHKFEFLREMRCRKRFERPKIILPLKNIYKSGISIIKTQHCLRSKHIQEQNRHAQFCCYCCYKCRPAYQIWLSRFRTLLAKRGSFHLTKHHRRESLNQLQVFLTSFSINGRCMCVCVRGGGSPCILTYLPTSQSEKHLYH